MPIQTREKPSDEGDAGTRETPSRRSEVAGWVLAVGFVLFAVALTEPLWRSVVEVSARGYPLVLRCHCGRTMCAGESECFGCQMARLRREQHGARPEQLDQYERTVSE